MGLKQWRWRRASKLLLRTQFTKTDCRMYFCRSFMKYSRSREMSVLRSFLIVRLQFSNTQRKWS